MKINQIPFPIKVRVLRRHIVGGVCGNPKRCGLSIATREAIYRKTKKYAAVSVYGGSIGILFANNIPDLNCGLSKRAVLAGRGTSRKIKSFVSHHDKCRFKADRVKVIKPFSFVIKGVCSE